MERDLIKTAKNSVGPGFGPGKNDPISLHTTNTSVYRVTRMNQIQDIIDCGHVRPKGYGNRADRVGNIIYWSQGNSNLYYNDKRPVIEASIQKVQDEQIGAIPISDLTAIWIFDENENKYVNRLEQIKQMHFDKLRELDKKPTTTTIEELKSVLSEPGYIWIGHGIGRSGNSDNVVDSIFQKGLRTKDNSLYYTSTILSTPTPEIIKNNERLGLPKPTIEGLRSQLNNWQHLDSKKIIIARIPTEYINSLGESSDLDGEMYGAFMDEEVENERIIYYLDPRFIFGCYDAETQLVKINKSFENTLSERTIKQLQDGYRKAILKTKKRIERTSSFQNTSDNKLNNESAFDLPEYDNEELEYKTK